MAGHEHLMTLDELIADSRRTRDDSRARIEARRAEERATLDARIAEIMRDVETRLGDAVPDPLRPFVICVGLQVSDEVLRMYPDQWTPCDFRIEAPSLATIRFTTTTDGPSDPLRVTLIQVDRTGFGADWAEAIAAAADLHEEQQSAEIEIRAGISSASVDMPE